MTNTIFYVYSFIEKKLEKLPFFSATHIISMSVTGYLLSMHDEYSARYDHIETLSQCVE